MPQIHFSPATSGDASLLHRLHSQSWPHSNPNGTEEDRLLYAATHDEKYWQHVVDTHHVTLLLEDGVLVGFSQVEEILGEENKRLLENLFVAPPHFGKGYGPLLLDHVLVTLKQKGIKTVHLDVGPANMRAQKIYEAKGFTFTGDEQTFHSIMWLGMEVNL